MFAGWLEGWKADAAPCVCGVQQCVSALFKRQQAFPRFLACLLAHAHTHTHTCTDTHTRTHTHTHTHTHMHRYTHMHTHTHTWHKTMIYNGLIYQHLYMP